MHLTLDLCYDAPFDCLGAWCLKSTTAFLDDEELNLPWYFGVFCWNYVLGGIVMIYTKPKSARFPFTLFALALIFIQAPLSFCADYLHISHDSMWHVWDRGAAIPMLGMDIWHVSLKPKKYTLLLMLAVLAFLQSQQSQARQDRDGFVLWHNVWHMYPLVAAAMTGHDYHREKQRTLRPPLLSSVLMTGITSKKLQ